MARKAREEVIGLAEEIISYLSDDRKPDIISACKYIIKHNFQREGEGGYWTFIKETET